MSENRILKEDLVTRFTEGLKLFHFTKATIERDLYGIRALFSFMEKEGFTAYTQDIGEKYVQHLKQDESISIYCKRRNLCSIHLLDTILENKPYSRRPVKNVLYPFPGDIGNMAKIFIQHLRTEERLSIHTIAQ